MVTPFQRALKKAKRDYVQKRKTTGVSSLSIRLPRGVNQITAIPRGRAFPQYTDVCLKYIDSMELDTTAGLSGTYIFRANSCFDPDFTGTGHQPMGFDQWAAFYYRYRVVKSKITVIATTTNPQVAAGQAIVGVRTSAVSTTINNLQRNMELPNNQFTVVSGSPQTKSISCNWNIKAVANGTNEENLSAEVTNNPQQDEYFYVYWGGLTTLDDPSQVRFIFMIDYTVRFYDPKELGQS